jgi:hypothetical protein
MIGDASEGDPPVQCSATPAVADGPPPADSRLASLYESGRWTSLLEALQGHKAPALYRGAVAAVFNQDRVAERLLRSVIASDPRSEQAYQAYEWLAHIYFRTGRYRQFIADMEARWAAFPNKSEIEDEQAAVAGFRGLPDQVTGKTGPAKLPHEPGEIFIPVSINGGSATFFFDTGAWVNCMSESEAKRLGLAIHDADGTLAPARESGSVSAQRWLLKSSLVRVDFRMCPSPSFQTTRSRGPTCPSGGVA